MAEMENLATLKAIGQMLIVVHFHIQIVIDNAMFPYQERHFVTSILKYQFWEDQFPLNNTFVNVPGCLIMECQ